MTLLKFASATAWARVVTTCVAKRLFANRHHFFGFSASLQQSPHKLHVEINVVEELFEPGAQIVESRLAVRCINESVLGAFAVTGKAHGTFH
ncbi:MAG: hypothetical protein M9928_22655, partial [Anaerolineae bacterium]|nr:hypothetical protein [Anaerolineae bacterium]